MLHHQIARPASPLQNDLLHLFNLSHAMERAACPFWQQCTQHGGSSAQKFNQELTWPTNSYQKLPCQTALADANGILIQCITVCRFWGILLSKIDCHCFAKNQDKCHSDSVWLVKDGHQPKTFTHKLGHAGLSNSSSPLSPSSSFLWPWLKTHGCSEPKSYENSASWSNPTVV